MPNEPDHGATVTAARETERVTDTDALVTARLITERILLSALRDQDMTTEAVAARQRAQSLSDASLQLGASLERGRTYAAIAALVLPDQSTWGVVDVIELDGTIRRVGVLHADPAQHDAVRTLLGQWTPSSSDAIGVPVITQSSRPRSVDVGAEALLCGAEQNAAVLRAIRSMGVGSFAVLPILAHDVLLGAITLARPRGTPDVGSDERRFYQALAARCAQALESMRLYEARQSLLAEVATSRALFRALTEHSRELVAIMDAQGFITYLNPSVEHTIGYTPMELLGTALAALVHRDDRRALLKAFARLVRGGPGAAVDMIVRLRHKDGSWRYFEGGGQNLLHDSSVRGITSNVRDVTARIELEVQLRQAQKMEAIGRLAGGVAHDFNNLLTIISAHSTFLLERFNPGDTEHEDAEAIRAAGDRAAALTRQLLAFSRKQILRPVAIDLNRVIVETKKLLTRLLGEEVAIVTRLEAGLAPVIADATQVDQLIMNLALNARDAMPDGGRLTLATHTTWIAGDDTETWLGVPAGRYTSLVVSDTGVGMEPSVQSHIFEPFFTTKDQGQGTGLGLATVYGVVQQCSGYITVVSAPDAGSTFHVLLPAVVASVAASAESRAPDIGAETILVVEDEPMVRAVVCQILRRKGYTVLAADGGEAALALSASFASPIQLVVSDAIMPGMRGAEAIRQLRAQRPDVKAILMSGYTDDEFTRQNITSNTVPFIQKPFSAANFAALIRSVLDS